MELAFGTLFGQLIGVLLIVLIMSLIIYFVLLVPMSLKRIANELAGVKEELRNRQGQDQ